MANTKVETQPLIIEIVWMTLVGSVRTLRAIWHRHVRVLATSVLLLGVIIIFAGPGFVRAEGDYPWTSALPTGTTGDYWMDENGNGKYDFAEQFDQWGYTYRNCTSWVAWRLNSLGATNMNYLGDAANWDNNAIKRGLVVDKKPLVGDAAVWDGSTKNPGGHLAFVEKVNADGSVVVSEYNKNLRGEFSNGRVARATHYIHFLTTAQRQLLEPPTPKPEEPTKAIPQPAELITTLTPTSKAPEATVPVVTPKPGGAVSFSADINGDHKVDLVSIRPNTDGKAEIYWKQSVGTKFSPKQLLVATDVLASDVHWAAGDVTGDGLDDVVALTKRDDGGVDIKVFRSAGTTLSAAEAWLSTTADQPFKQTEFLLGDVDGDGKKDLTAVVTPTNQSDVEPKVFWIQSLGDHFAPPALVTD